MTIAERNEKLKHYITCLKCGVSGKPCYDNCATRYNAGNMGEIIENLEAISKAIEQEPCEDAISRQAVLKIYDEWFSSCNIADKKESPKVQINALPPVNPQKEVDDVLDKIKAEIEFEIDHRTNTLCAEDVFAILDKYKAESEGKNEL